MVNTKCRADGVGIKVHIWLSSSFLGVSPSPFLILTDISSNSTDAVELPFLLKYKSADVQGLDGVRENLGTPKKAFKHFYFTFWWRIESWKTMKGWMLGNISISCSCEGWNLDQLLLLWCPKEKEKSQTSLSVSVSFLRKESIIWTFFMFLWCMNLT